jgi:SprT protein
MPLRGRKEQHELEVEGRGWPASGPPGGPDTVLTDWCAKAALALGLPTLARRVEVRWNLRMRSTAGRASWPDRVIELNPRLAALEADPSGHPLSATLKHELAHLVAYERAGRRRIRPHGIEWAQACVDLGIPGETACHLLPFPRRRQKRRYHYTCPVCARMLKRVKPVKGRVACYTCCSKVSGGRYDRRFQLIETKVD